MVAAAKVYKETFHRTAVTTGEENPNFLSINKRPSLLVVHPVYLFHQNNEINFALFCILYFHQGSPDY